MTRRVLAVSLILLLWANRLPAPIVELESTPPPVNATKIAKPAPAATKAPRASRSELDLFKGTWVYNLSVPEDSATSPPTSPYTMQVIMKVKDAGAAFEYSETDTLVTDYWAESTGIPPPYNRAREKYIKIVATSEKMQVTGSTLSIRWSPWNIVDWTPKMPKSVLLGTRRVRTLVNTTRDWAFELIGNTRLKAGTQVYHRVK